MGRAIETAKQICRAWFRRAAIQQELNRLRSYEFRDGMTYISERELDRGLADIGFTRDDIPGIVHGQAHAGELLPMMLDWLGLDVGRTNDEPGTMREIQLRCGSCPNPARCRRWLNDEGVSDDYHAFCPNGKTLDDLPRHGEATT